MDSLPTNAYSPAVPKALETTQIAGAPAIAGCAQTDCPLPAEFAHDHCILHTRRVGKGSDPTEKKALHAAFAKLGELGVIRIRDLYLVGADLSGIFLQLKNLQHSDLTGASFHNARFQKVGFDFSNLDQVDFESAILEKVDLRRASVHSARWYETIFDGVQIPNLAKIGLDNPYEQGELRDPNKAFYVYNLFKKQYADNADFDTSGLFYEREMDLKRHTGSLVDRGWWWTLWATCGYGEKPRRTAALFFVVIFGFACIYTACDMNVPDGDSNNFLTCLYFSVVTFTSLGYGEVTPVGWARFFAASEALIGVFSISLFVFVFCRRMTR